MSTRHRPAAMLHQASIPCIIWAEDAIRQFGCRVLVSHLFLVAKMCLLGSGEYTEVHSSTGYYGEGIFSAAPRLISLQDDIDDSLPIALLRASDWAYIHPLSLSREPQFPSLSTLLSSLPLGRGFRSHTPDFHLAYLRGLPRFTKLARILH